ncbi:MULTISPECIES: alcohol dehydrogenase catalytic domain-containing protein [unclassified Streptomyces]|uniref:alcohol dehydrogenase catalytic domain-containing protein n=1 Tax=unclassified Streptomyces TaxID=2593676 RepID=UPI0005AB13E2|nr:MULTISPECIES: alcohol dehydrogenase catalytic domain-containing protein [unclassified Streptomyces]ODA72714.1 putative zinc-type alcohol dehydrogenase-like protein YjmD [Streptomyces sp. AVP053U2]
MRGLVYHGPAQTSWDTVPDPAIEEDTDAIVRVDATTICGSDLHIQRGDLPEVKPGTVLGHEAAGEVVEVGRGVHNRRPGHQVIVSSVSACGHCPMCRASMYGQCQGGGGWVLGNMINGTQAEFVRVPFADSSTHRRPSSLPLGDAVLLAELLPTAYEVGVRNGHVSPGDTVVVVGAGPVGLAAVIIARLYSPRRIIAVDLSSSRLEAAARLGADAAELPGRLIADLSEGPGADVVIEAVGDPESFLLSTRVVRSGGHIANIGMPGSPVTLHLEALWRKNLTISTGQVDTFSTPWLLDLVTFGRISVSPLVTHVFGLDRVEDAYEVFSRGPDTGALKVMLRREAKAPSRQPYP